MGDEFVTIEHLWLSLLDVNSEVSKILKDFGVTKKFGNGNSRIKKRKQGNFCKLRRNVSIFK
jgi:ATP-dependent Clp protease ATP-binding subunit ClpB